MAKPKERPARRVAGASKFRLPERIARTVEENPLRDILLEARAQEDAQALAERETAFTAEKTESEKSRPARKVRTRQANVPAVSQANRTAPLLSLTKRLPLNTETAEASAAFSEFLAGWSKVLHSGQIKICRTLYELTHAIGREECFTSMPKLALAAGLKERQCYNLVKQLEFLGIIVRPHIYNTATKKGTIFRLLLSPEQTGVSEEKQYHIGAQQVVK